MSFLQTIIYEGQDKNPEMCRVLLTHEIMCRLDMRVTKVYVEFTAGLRRGHDGVKGHTLTSLSVRAAM